MKHNSFSQYVRPQLSGRDSASKSNFAPDLPFAHSWGHLVVLAILALPLVTQASSTIAPGWDLLQTDSAITTLFGTAFEGVPMNTFDFSGAIGVKDVGSTDTIVRRVSPASGPGPGSSATVATVVDSLQLRSVASVSILGGPLGIYYLTLQSQRGGPISSGSETINFGPEGDPHGTFSSSFDLYVDFRLNSLSGPILDSRLISIADSGLVPWRHESTGDIQIPGVNLDLNGSTSANDLWIEGDVVKQSSSGSFAWRNTSATTGVPDSGSSVLLLSCALGGMALGGKSSFAFLRG